MTLSLSVKGDIDDVLKDLTRQQKKQVPFAAAKALTLTAKGAQKAVQKVMHKQLDRPTPFTIRGVAIIPAKKTHLTSTVFIKDIQFEYLQYQMYGGTRTPRGRALVVPAYATKLNKFGNLTKGKIQRLLADPNHFSGVVNGVPGIYRRFKRKPPKLVVMYTKSASYTRRFHFHRTVEKNAAANFARHFDKTMREALATAR